MVTTKIMEELRNKAKSKGAKAHIISTTDLVFDKRASLMCMTCKRYGKKATCPPHVRDGLEGIVKSYSCGLLVIMEFDTPKSEGLNLPMGRKSGKALHELLLKLEKQAKRAGYVFTIAFIGGSCKMCGTETCKAPCAQPEKGRIPIEAIGINVIETCKSQGYNLKFPIEDTFCRVGLLLVG